MDYATQDFCRILKKKLDDERRETGEYEAMRRSVEMFEGSRYRPNIADIFTDLMRGQRQEVQALEDLHDKICREIGDPYESHRYESEESMAQHYNPRDIKVFGPDVNFKGKDRPMQPGNITLTPSQQLFRDLDNEEAQQEAEYQNTIDGRSECEPSIRTVRGEAYYYTLLKDPEFQRRAAEFSTRDGFYVTHHGKYHCVYRLW